MRWLLRWRRIVIVAIHLLIFVVANRLAFWLRFEGSIPPDEWLIFVDTIPILLAIRALVFIPFRLFEGLWRYTSILDLRSLIVASALSEAIFYAVVQWYLDMGYSRSVALTDAILIIFFVGGLRLLRRIVHGLGRLDRGRRVLIYGAGDAGEMLVRDMIRNPEYEYEPVGFVDDSPSKVGQRIHGIPVLGTRHDLERIVAQEDPHEILIAMPRVGPATIRDVLKVLEPFKLPIKTVPALHEIVNGHVSTREVRNLAIEDLLPRAPVGLDLAPLRTLINGRSILVTGAGGSIGSELCRQLAALEPRALLLYERHENSLHQIETALREAGAKTVPILGDVTDSTRLTAVFKGQRPDIVFHAAAHKHVPLVEWNPVEAVRNNVLGTRLVATLAAEHATSRFVMISTDKAVNPTSIMGATKRIAELTVQDLARRTGTCFLIVRFGNVLGSNGSVVPRFVAQIASGGPVTVTHPDMTRYFMLIPEAVQLVMHAAALARGSEIFVLDTGEQLNVGELARSLIRLMGFVPDRDIPIRFIGPRPGEKLSEELVGIDETLVKSAIEKIMIVQSASSLDAATVSAGLQALERLVAEDDDAGVIKTLAELVPTFRPDPNTGHS